MGFKIKELREKRKMTQVELATKSGVSRTLIAGLECGSLVETSTVTLKKLAEALECNVSDIFCN